MYHASFDTLAKLSQAERDRFDAFLAADEEACPEHERG
jgi:hypothetical protein